METKQDKVPKRVVDKSLFRLVMEFKKSGDGDRV